MLLSPKFIFAICTLCSVIQQAAPIDAVGYVRNNLSNLFSRFKGSPVEDASDSSCQDESRYCALYHKILQYQCEDVHFGQAVKEACPATCNECGANKGKNIVDIQDPNERDNEDDNDPEFSSAPSEKDEERVADSRTHFRALNQLTSNADNSESPRAEEEDKSEGAKSKEPENKSPNSEPADSGDADATNSKPNSGAATNSQEKPTVANSDATSKPEEPPLEEEAFDVVDKEDPADTDLSDLGGAWTDKDEAQAEKVEKEEKEEKEEEKAEKANGQFRHPLHRLQPSAENSAAAFAPAHATSKANAGKPDSSEASSKTKESSETQESKESDESPWKDDERIYSAKVNSGGTSAGAKESKERPVEGPRREPDASVPDYGDSYHGVAGTENGGSMNTQPVGYP